MSKAYDELNDIHDNSGDFYSRNRNEEKMQEKIWAGVPDIYGRSGATRSWYESRLFREDTPYIRADIVEELAQLLDDALHCDVDYQNAWRALREFRNLTP